MLGQKPKLNILIENPLKDHHIVQNEYDIEIKKGIEIEIPEIFEQTLITEGVINKPGAAKSKKLNRGK